MLGTPLAALGIELPFTTAAVVIASFFGAAPFYVRAARSGFLAVPREYEETARAEGATEWEVFRYVTAPVAAPALFGGAILCWARALGEFGATIMFAGQFLSRTQTMPFAIYAALEQAHDRGVIPSLLDPVRGHGPKVPRNLAFVVRRATCFKSFVEEFCSALVLAASAARTRSSHGSSASPTKIAPDQKATSF